MLQYIIWDVSPEIFRIGWFAVRWYGLLFALSFLLGYNLIARIFKWEDKPERDLEWLFILTIICTVVGARLGHVIFYDLKDYLKNPISIFKVWEGGLASHGAAIALIIGIYIYARKRPGQSFWWVIDRLVIAVAIGGALIRTGNLMNSEIIGKPVDLPFAVAFTHSLDAHLENVQGSGFAYSTKKALPTSDTTVKGIVYKPMEVKLYFDKHKKASAESVKGFIEADLTNLLTMGQGQEVNKHYATLGKSFATKITENDRYVMAVINVYAIPRHAGQFYEAISCIFLFGLLFLVYIRQKERTPEGQLFGIFMIVCFGLRFCFEFLKENQVSFEDSLSFNMGQILSIPAVLVGIVALVLSLTRKPKAS